MIENIKEKVSFSDIVFMLSIFLTGCFNEHVAAFISCIISAYFFLRIVKEKRLRVQINLMSVAVILICLSYGVTCFWAIDSGMAFIGFIKFLPVLLYLLMIWQEKRETQILTYLPYFAAGLVVISAVGAQVPFLEDFFVVAGRFAGIFQYPNTFALFLLVCELLLLQKGRIRLVDGISIGILVGGILYTGSRTVFILFFVSNFLMLLLIINKKMRVTMLLITVLAIGVVVVLMLAFRDNAIISRYMSIGLGASTFVGRMLYVLDALPLLVKYPFGMGYMGYYYIQNSIQTGVYNVTFVHNDFLQIFLDIGWIPGITFLVAVIAFFLNKSVPISKKVIVGTFCLHTLLDFNLQFASMFVLLLLFVGMEDGKEKIIQVNAWCKVAAWIVLIVNLYMMAALGLAYYKQMDLANTLYPYNTRNNLLMMEAETDLQEADGIADRILAQNQTYFAPYSVKAKYAYSQGDFMGVIENKNKVFERYPFKYTEYKEYCVMLINGVAAYTRQGDETSVNVCNQEILVADKKLASNKERLSKLGSKIDEQPILEFSENVAEYIEQLKRGVK